MHVDVLDVGRNVGVLLRRGVLRHRLLSENL